jgi:peroxiredoxin family protein
MSYSKVEGFNNFVRDEKSLAVINTNFNEYEKYMMEKEKKKREHERISLIESDVADLKTDIGEIKSLLHQIITRL